MTPDVSAIVVTHRTAGEALSCVDSLRRTFSSDGVRGEIVLVDCGSGAADVRRLESGGADVFLPLPDNRGYSGGVNAGLARATSFRLLLANADVVFRPGSVSALLLETDAEGVGAVAPLTFWDDAERMLLPVGWLPGFRSDLAQLSSGRRAAREERSFAAYARESVRLWRSGGDVGHLSGAVLAARRETFDRVGRFDERFPFEFEETEWEDRVRAEGLALRVVAAARVVHRWGASASGSEETAARRLRSLRLYRRRRYGRLGRAILERAARRSVPAPFPRRAELRLEPVAGAWVALSTNASLLPFAGALLDRPFELPEEVAARLPRLPLYVRTFSEADGKPLDTFVWERDAE
jgi:GT2 family glycosyltransferase